MSPRRGCKIKLARKGWKWEMVSVAHRFVGGATDGVFCIGCCHKVNAKPFKFESHDFVLEGTLRDIIDTTVGFGSRKRSHEEISDGEPNTHLGVLDWKRRNTNTVVVPTVYDKTKLVTKKLTSHEF